MNLPISIHNYLAQYLNYLITEFTLAGLCHDLGHGAFSHLWETFVHEARDGYQWCHEETSIAMLDHIIKENDLMPVFKSFGLTEQDIIFVKVSDFH